MAILLVIGRHPVVEADEAGRLAPLASLWLRFGWTGVDLFFVLSGFLVGGLLFAELRAKGHLDVRRFLVRRGFKIWPSYYVYLAVAAMLIKIDLGGPPLKYARTITVSLLPNLAHAQNYLGTPLYHTWSLAVEEHFYLLLPIALLVLPRRAVPALALLIGVACLALRVATPEPPKDAMLSVLTPTHLRIDSLSFGVLLAYVAHFFPATWDRFGRHRSLLLASGLALVAPMAVLTLGTDPIIFRAGFTSLYLGYGCLLIAAVHLPDRLFAGRIARAVARVGVASYSIYLWHLDGGRRIIGMLLDRGWPARPEVPQGDGTVLVMTEIQT